MTFFIITTISIFILHQPRFFFFSRTYVSDVKCKSIFVWQPWAGFHKDILFHTANFFYEGKVLLCYQFPITDKNKVFFMKFEETITFVILFPTSTYRSSCLFCCLPFRKAWKTYAPAVLATKSRHSCTHGIYITKVSKNSTTSNI